MGLTVAPVREQDIDRLIAIEFAAYADNPLGQFFRARDGSNPAHIARAQARHRHFLLSDPSAHHAKVVDEADGAIVGWMRWEDMPDGMDESLPLDHVYSSWPFELNTEEQRDMIKEYYATYERERRQVLGSQAHCFLALLVVHPEYQRRGAGQALMRHLVQEVDRRNVVAYLDSSKAGKGLYERFGFSSEMDSVFEVNASGVSGTRVHTVMIRPAQRSQPE